MDQYTYGALAASDSFPTESYPPYGYSGEYYSSSNTGQTRESQDTLNERYGRLDLDPVPEEGESHEANHDDIYEA
jgi:hypothetical protein